ncbi:biopolymer transporter ExbD [Rhodocytophaga aerolata]|uniref:Biopolymer transporter ExbD n=1 Tax=Rhodocytophaga aerolata TaxID=455078 RepID=A0ABT8QYB4_9BACT|nr:biopolymer transporter ExbD [Rhodocytophaga aerolata]MDO1444827.1 biopolymer transporter ExbD [Rhodocytophaga aerolata]
MALQSKNKVDPSFSLSSMTDMVFLLLIFFMLTSSFVTPSGLPVSLPSSKASNIEIQKVSVTVTKDLQFYVNDKKTTEAGIESDLRQALAGGEEGAVILHVDESVPVKYVTKIGGIATSLKAKVSIATKPE